MRDQGPKPAFALMFFHFPKDQIPKEHLDKNWTYYNYKNFQKPLLVRLLKDDFKHNYIVGISCLKARSKFESAFGYTMSAGGGEVDKEKGTCRSLAIVFPKPKYNVELNYQSLDYHV
jgi:hypothetical protein